MANSSVWNDDDQAFQEGKIRPLFTLEKLSDDAAVLAWMNNTYAVELKRALPYREQALKHIALYKGRFYGQDGARSADTSTNGMPANASKPNKLVVNHLFDLVNQRVARVLRTSSDVEIAPANSEYRDRISAKIVTMWKDYLFYQNDFDVIKARVSKATFICGESYVWVRWNPNLGDVHPDWLAEVDAAKREGRTPRLPLNDPQGNQIIGQDGEPLWIEKGEKTGDVELKVCTPLNTLVQFTGDFSKSEYFIYEEYVDIDELRALYPHKASEIEGDKHDEDDAITRWRTVQGIANGPQEGKVLVRYFRQKPTDFLESGRWIVSTRTAILENKPLELGEQGLHLIRITDYDVEGEQRGQSFFLQGKMLNAAINDLTSMGMRNMKMLAHPKWTLPKGSVVKKDALGNDIALVEFSGPIEPKIQVPPPMNQENMVVKSDLKTDMQLILGSNGGDRGQIPPNIRTTTGLQAFYEQEDMRASQQNLKQATFVREVVEAAINVAATHYEKEDKRMLPIVGKGNRFLLKEFDPAILMRGYDVRVKNGSSRPTSGSVRFDWAIQMRKEIPTYMTEERFADFMEWGDDSKVLDAVTKALRAAEAENEAILSMEEIDEPAPYEMHIQHWMTHALEVQDRSFKADVPEEIQARFVAHINATEDLMMQAARKNPRFAVELVKIPQWPLFYNLSAEDYMVLDAARSGNPLPLSMVAILYENGAAALAKAGVGGQAPPAPAGGFNPQTNGVNGSAEGNPSRVNTMAPPKQQNSLEPAQDEAPSPPAANPAAP